MDLSSWEWIGRLAVAAALSGLIGFEREAHHKAAGLRTHILVGMGAALFTLAGLESLSAQDLSRMAAGVVTGVGFLGAGAIFRYGGSVRGLTTAAGLWVAAAIGVAAGAGEILPAFAASVLAVATLNGLSLLERAMQRRSDRHADRVVLYLADARVLGDVLSIVTGIDDQARECDVRMEGDGSVAITFLTRPAHTASVKALLGTVEGVAAIEEDRRS